jgi:hypothetical protein
MLQEKEPSVNSEAVEIPNVWKNPSLRAIIICASLSVVFLKSGFLSMVFLVPLGYAVLAYDALFLTVSVTAAIHVIVSVMLRLIFYDDLRFLGIELIYLSFQIIGFAWIMAGSRFTNIRTAYRFIISSAAAAGIFLLLIFITRKDPGFGSIINSLSTLFSSMLLSSSGTDAVTYSYLQQMMTPEYIQKIFYMVILRGGAIATVLILFFINRQIVNAMLWFFKRKKTGQTLSGFFTPPNTIWALSCSLALILITRMFRIEFIEVLAWNVFTVCGILFLAQGAGIVIHLLSRRQGIFRMVAAVLIIFVIISPGINAIALAALLLIGITENWVAFRISKYETKD